MKHTDYHPNTYVKSAIFARELVDTAKFSLNMSATDESLEFHRVEKLLHRYIINHFPNEDVNSSLALNQLNMLSYLTGQIHLLREFTYFKESGRNIIHVEPVLCELLANTDVDEVVLSDLKWPYDRFYIHYGHASGITYGVHSVVGAYVHIFFEKDFTPGNEPVVIDVMLITKTDDSHRDRSDTFLATVSNDPVHNISFCADHGEKAIDSVRWGQNAVLSDKFSQDDDKNWTSHYPSIARLIINTICYITDPSSDIENEHPDDAPDILIKKIREAKDEAVRNRRVSKLDSMGYSIIRVCGRELQRQYQSSLGAHEGPRPHWRRGHWRHQPHGKGLLLRKLVWIKPTLVAKEKGFPDHGHIYKLNE